MCAGWLKSGEVGEEQGAGFSIRLGVGLLFRSEPCGQGWDWRFPLHPLLRGQSRGESYETACEIVAG